MSKKFKNLSLGDKDVIIQAYKEYESRKEAQNFLSDYFGVIPRTIRSWAKKLRLLDVPASRVMIYDIETARIPATVWWSGKQYVSAEQLDGEPTIISVAWKWLGEDKVHHLEWDKNHSDETLMEKFLKHYNKADLVIGYNNKNFDDRYINARAIRYGLEVNTFVRSLDLMKQSKRLFRLPSYSLKNLCIHLDVTQKLSHEGILMWDMVERGTPEQQKEYLSKMVEYNIGDIISTEECYIKMIPYLKHQTHLGVMKGAPKYSCPNCGREDTVQIERRTATAAGTMQVIMKCTNDGSRFKISNREYMNYLDNKIKNHE